MEEFIRTQILLGQDAMNKLSRSRVAIFGIGGVGGYTVEALARAGVGKLDLIDSDKVSVSNINRQIIALHSTVGMKKTEAAKRRVQDINPNCIVTVCDEFYLPENADRFDFSQFDYVVDAVDTVTAKLSLIEKAKACGVPVISAMGAGNKLDPTAFRVADIHKTTGCPLARVIRTECRRRGITDVKVVYSEEKTRPVEQAIDPDRHSARRDTPGSAAFVTGVAGLIIAGEVIKDLIK